jgi:hypothetical protein
LISRGHANIKVNLCSEKYYAGIKDDPDLHVKLTGSWETIVGEQDLFIHILEYENYHGYDKTTKLIRQSEVSCHTPRVLDIQSTEHEQHFKAYQDMLKLINSRSSQLNQEFAFFPTAPPHAQGGLFELRSYQLKPGVLLEWENTWYDEPSPDHRQRSSGVLIGFFHRRRGIEARRKYVAPVGAWFSQVGRLHQVHHMWQYPYVATC